MSKHTPGPWHFSNDGRGVCEVKAAPIVEKGELLGYEPVAEGIAWAPDAEFIVRACNAHDDLLEALQGILEIGKRDMRNPKYDGYFEFARAVVSKARGAK